MRSRLSAFGPVGFIGVLLALPPLGSGALAQEFSVRWDDGGGPSPGTTVALYAACDPYDCGKAELEDRPVPQAALRGTLGANRVFRSEVPEERDAWWIVVDGDGRLPMAILWRVPVAGGDLEPTPVVGVRTCRLVVEDAAGARVAGARLSASPANVSASGGRAANRPAVFDGWRPWYRPVRTDSRGTADFVVPVSSAVTLALRAQGFRMGSASCTAGQRVVVVLERRVPRSFQLQDELGEPLRAALVRDRWGHALALSDEFGQVQLDPAEGRTQALIVETSSGAVYEAALGAGSRVVARRLSRTFKGRMDFDARDALADYGSMERPVAYWWREAEQSWRAGDFLAAAPLGRSAFGAYEAELLEGEALWFAAAGYGYGRCTARRLATSGSAARRDVSGPSACPIFRPARQVLGSVVDDQNQPVAGAEILIDWMEPRSNDVTVVRGKVPGSPGASLLLLRSGRNGRFVTDRVGGALTASFLDFVGVRVERPGYLPVGRKPVASYPNGEDGILIQLDCGTSVVGRIANGATGDPVPGAEVGIGRFMTAGHPLVLGPLSSRADGPFGRVQSALSRADGTFELSAWPGKWDVLVRSEGMAQRQLRGVDVGSAGVDVGVVQLERAFSVSGFVLAETGQPIPEAQIQVVGTRVRGLFGARDGGYGRFRNGMQMSSDETGKFRIDGLAADARVDVRVSASGFVATVVERVSPERAGPLGVTLRRGARIAGTVRFAGRPAGGRVGLRPQSGDVLSAAILDSDGLFSFEDLAPGRYSVAVGPEAEGVRRWRRSVTLAAGESLELDIELEREDQDRMLHGRVTARGAGVVGAEVRVGRRRTSTGPDGEYRFERLGSGPHVVVVEPGAGYLARSREVRIDGRSRRVDFDVSRFGVKGRALWDDGTPVQAADLLFMSSFEMRTGASAQVGYDGSFEVELEEGEFVVSVRPEHGETGRAVSRLRVAGPVSDADLRFRRGSRLAGRVDGLGTEEIGRLQVEAVNVDEFDHRLAEVDNNGRFEVGEVSAGFWLVVATVGGSERRADRRVRAGGGEDVDVVLRFERRFRLEGAVRLDGQPFRSTQVVLMEGADRTSLRRTWTGLDGSFTFRDLDRGSYFVGVGAGVREVAVRSDEYLSIDLRSGVIRGIVHLPGTELPSSGTEVLAWPSEVTRYDADRLGIVQRTYTDLAGEFRFDRLPEGSWRVQAGASPRLVSTVRVGAGPVPFVSLGGGGRAAPPD